MAEVEQLNLVRQIDPRTNLSGFQRRTYAVFDSGSDISFINRNVSGGLSNNQLTFDVNPPSKRVFINRRPELNFVFDITFTGTSAGAGIPLLQCAGLTGAPGVNVGTQYYDAPRAYPLAQAMSNINITMANGGVSSNLNQYIRAFPTYSTSVKGQNTTFSATPCMLDQSQSYSDLDGFARDPLRGYGDNPLQTPRGGFIGCTVLRNDSTGAPGDVAIVRMNITENIFLSPFVFEEGAEDTGFIGIDTMQVVIALGGRGLGLTSGLAASLWSHSPSGSVLTSVVADVVSANMLVSFMSPDPLQYIPDVNLYPLYQALDRPFTSSVSVAAGQLTTLTTNTIQFSSIPTRIYVFASRRDQDCNVSTTDTYFGIENVNITFENRDSLLAQARPIDLYNIAVKNGTVLSWNQWTKETGAVLALDFGPDITLKTNQAPGLRGKFNFQLTVSVRNLSASAVIPTLHCVEISEGVLEINNGYVSTSLGVLSEMNVLASKSLPETLYSPSGSVYGGNFFSGFKKFMADAGKFIKKNARPAIEAAKRVVPMIAPEFAPVLQTVDDVARSLGLGLVGGRKMSRAQLMKRIEKS